MTAKNKNIHKYCKKTTIEETTPTAKPIINLADKSHLKWVFLILEAHMDYIGDIRPYSEILEKTPRLII